MAGTTERVTVRMDSETHERAKFWASRISSTTGAPTSLNEFIAMAVENEIARRSGVPVDAQDLMTGRINQLTDAVKAMESQLSSVSTVVGSGFDTLISLTRGDNFLMDAAESESGELDDL